MTIGVISDTHGNLAAWTAAQEYFEGAELIVHCGDVLYHGPKFQPVAEYDPARLAEAINACPVPVIIARGNGDSNVDQLVLDVPVQNPYALVQWGDQRLLVAHGDGPTADELLPLARKWQINFLFTGHLHVPMVRGVDGVMHVNPGSPTYPLGDDPRPTIARLVDGVPEIIQL